MPETELPRMGDVESPVSEKNPSRQFGEESKPTYRRKASLSITFVGVPRKPSGVAYIRHPSPHA